MSSLIFQVLFLSPQARLISRQNRTMTAIHYIFLACSRHSDSRRQAKNNGDEKINEGREPSLSP